MRILLCGWDGFTGYALAQNLLERGHHVYGLDNCNRRRMAKELGVDSIIPIKSWSERIRYLFNNYNFQTYPRQVDISKESELPILAEIFKDFKPEAIINLAQQPSAPYSMIDAKHGLFTMKNNVGGVENLAWMMRDYTPEAPLLSLGTMGSWSTPNMRIPEGFFQVQYEGMTDILPFPKQTNSVYHCSKEQASSFMWMACRTWGIHATDVQQGVIYGTKTDTIMDNTRMDADQCMGTFLNRAIACSIINHPILVYGSGMQTRAYIALEDSIKCLTLLVETPPTDDDSIHGYRVINQFDEYYSCNDVADIVIKVAEQFDLHPTIKHIENPRVEPEVHYYNPKHEKLYKMGWKPTRKLEDELVRIFEDLILHKERILKYKDKIIPTIKWRKS